MDEGRWIGWPRIGAVDNLSMRIATVLLLILLGVVHAELWFGKGGLPRVWALQEEVTALKKANAQAEVRNDQLAAEVRDLREGLDMVEERARMELGMLKADELYVHFSDEPAQQRGPGGAAPPQDRPQAR